MSRQSKGSIMLTIAALIWGAAFVAQSVGMDYIGPFTFTAARSFLGVIVLLPCIFIMGKSGRDKSDEKATGLETTARAGKDLIKGGILCGIALFAGSSSQQVGVQFTTAGKAGFITALYIVIVPVLGIVLGKKTGIRKWISVLLAVAGFYFLSVKDGFSISYGDSIILLSAFLFAGHILLISHYSRKADGIQLSCVQFLVCGILASVVMVFREQPSWEGILDARYPILYTGIMSSGVAYTFQVIAQKHVNPVLASLIMSLESVFSVLFGWLLLREMLSFREIAGCSIVFAAIILAQIPESVKTAESGKKEGFSVTELAEKQPAQEAG